MEIRTIGQRCSRWFQKYKYVLVILLAGIVLMWFPARKTNTVETEETREILTGKTTEERLEEILSKLHGAGKVTVMLTIAEGERIIYQFDEDLNWSDSSNSSRKDTVIITDSGRNEQAVITQVMPPVYLGAVVLCQGADQPAVKLAVVEAVSKLTGLGADKISVLKLK